MFLRKLARIKFCRIESYLELEDFKLMKKFPDCIRMTPGCSQADNWSGYFWQAKRYEHRVSSLIRTFVIKRKLVHFMFVLRFLVIKFTIGNNTEKEKKISTMKSISNVLSGFFHLFCNRPFSILKQVSCLLFCYEALVYQQM